MGRSRRGVGSWLALTVLVTSVAAVELALGAPVGLPNAERLSAADIAKIEALHSDDVELGVGPGSTTASRNLAAAPRKAKPVTESVVDAATTETSQLIRRSDGTIVQRVSSAPVRFKDANGVWVDVDTTLVADENGVHAKATKHPVRVDENTGPRAAIMTAAGELLSSPELPGVDPVARGSKNGLARGLNKSGADYRDAAGNGVSFEAMASGLKESVVATSTAGPAGYRSNVIVPEGLTARQGTNVVEFVDAAGTVQLIYGGGVAWDSRKGKTGGAVTPVIVHLVSAGDGTAVVEADVASDWWAQAKAPVTLVVRVAFVGLDRQLEPVFLVEFVGRLRVGWLVYL
jgi:hypothetical protein